MNVRKALINIFAKQNRYVKTTYYATPSRSWPSGTTWLTNLNYKPTPSQGYEIIGVVGFSANNNGSLIGNITYSKDNKKLMGNVRNLSSSAITDYFGIYLLEIKLGGGTN